MTIYDDNTNDFVVILRLYHHKLIVIIICIITLDLDIFLCITLRGKKSTFLSSYLDFTVLE